MQMSDERYTLSAMLVVGYASFVIWFCGWPMGPYAMSDGDQNEFTESFRGTAVLEEDIVGSDFAKFMEYDDGNPVIMNFKIKYRMSPAYPSNTPDSVTQAETVEEALSSFLWGSLPNAITYGTAPLAVMSDHGILFRSSDGEEDMEDHSAYNEDRYSQVRTDFLRVLLDACTSGAYAHKTAAIESMEVSVAEDFAPVFGSITATIQVLVAFTLLTVFHLSALVFPESPDVKELRKLREKAKKDKKKNKESGDKTSKKDDKNKDSKKDKKSSEKKDK